MVPDVVVVGAGPVGLLLAIELRLAGANVAVLERLTRPSTLTKALGMGALGAEALRRRGMAAANADAEARAMTAMRLFAERHPPAPDRSRLGGHFGGLAMLRRDLQDEPERRAVLVDQPSAEAMLGERAATLGIPVAAAPSRRCGRTTTAWMSPGSRRRSGAACAASTSLAATAGAAPCASWAASRFPARRRP